MLYMSRSRLAWMAIALLVAARALLPMGWMPVEKAGGIRIELCTGHGVITATVDSEGRLQQETDETAPEEACPYAVMAVPTDLPTLAELAEPLPAVAIVPVALATISILPYPHGPRPPTRGPPERA